MEFEMTGNRMNEDAQQGSALPRTEVDAADQGCLQTARSLAAGIVSGGMVHEFANLLTIIDGQRQMERLGLVGDGPTSDIGQMLGEPAERCQRLVEAFRYVFSDLESDVQEVPLSQELGSLEVLLAARLRGRSTRIEIDPIGSKLLLPGRGSQAMRLAFLLGLFAILEHGRARESYPGRISLGGEGYESSCRSMSAMVTAFRVAPVGHVNRATADRLLKTASELVLRFGGRLSLIDPNDGTASLRVHAPS